MSALYSFDYNGNTEDERDKSFSDEEINPLINESLEESQSNSEVVIQTREKREASLISESSEGSQTNSEVMNPKRNKNHSSLTKRLNWKVIAKLRVHRGRQNHFS